MFSLLTSRCVGNAFHASTVVGGVAELRLIVRSALAQTTEQGLTRSNVALRTQRSSRKVGPADYPDGSDRPSRCSSDGTCQEHHE